MGFDDVPTVIFKESKIHADPEAAEECAKYLLAQLQVAHRRNRLSYYVVGSGLLGRDVFTGDLIVGLREGFGLSGRELIEKANWEEFKTIFEKIQNTVSRMVGLFDHGPGV